MDELDLAEFKYGGVNITGLRLIDPARPLVRAMRREWRRLEPRYWDTVGTATTIKVRGELHGARSGNGVETGWERGGNVSGHRHGVGLSIRERIPHTAVIRRGR